jgi:hypothetical protein
MQRKSPETTRFEPKALAPYLRRGPIIPGRPLIPGRKELPFPAFLRIEEKPVTFREPCGQRPREEREEAILKLMESSRRNRKLVAVLIPHDIYSNPETAVFHAGWTLFQHEGEIRTRQCVVFLSGEAIPIGRSDQGVICLALRVSLSAWDGRTSEQSRASAA